MAAVTIFSDFGAQKIKSDTVSTVSPLFPMKWWDQMPWSSFSECCALSQLFHFHTHWVLTFLINFYSLVFVFFSFGFNLFFFLVAKRVLKTLILKLSIFLITIHITMSTVLTTCQFWYAFFFFIPLKIFSNFFHELVFDA